MRHIDLNSVSQELGLACERRGESVTDALLNETLLLFSAAACRGDSAPLETFSLISYRDEE